VEMVTAARAYGASGWPVFPVKADKTPYTQRGFKDASRDDRLISAWWEKWPEAGIGLAVPDGLLVLDIDPRNGGVRGEELPPTKEARTRSGGAHLYYRVPPDVPSFVGQYTTGVDVKAPGKGYVILPPTPGYAWTRRGMVDLPNDVLESCTRSRGFVREDTAPVSVRYLPWEKATRYGQVALDNQVAAVSGAANGERNNTLYKATASVARLIAGGELEEDYALKAVFLAAIGVGLDETETARTMESAFAAGIEEPRRAPE
jgi:hypothetical protein